MAVVYMKKLEEEPDTYHTEFTKLTKGINIQIQDWIMNDIDSQDTILEVGCGPGVLAAKMAKKGCSVIGLDINPKMIVVAKNSVNLNNSKVQFFQGDALTLEKISTLHTQSKFLLKSPFKLSLPSTTSSDSIKDDIPSPPSYSKIVSTFMLSELRPLQQQIFLRNSWKKLQDGGEMYLAAEFVPTGMANLKFRLERWYFKKRMKRLKKSTNPLKNFRKYLDPIGFKIIDEKSWKHGSIQVLHLQKVSTHKQIEPGYYIPPHKSFHGLQAWLRLARCLLTGQVDHVPIEPGIYRSGTPDRFSPIYITANYDYTYIKMMQKMNELDAWVLCVDSRGINVWCAARGDDFGNKQILEIVEATNISELSDNKTLILPQLAAGGVAIPELPKKNNNFPYIAKYGPVWAKDIEEYSNLPKGKKTEGMKRAKFSIKHRLRAGVTHLTFLYRKIFLTRILIFAILMAIFPFIRAWWFLGEVLLYVLITNTVISLLYPLSTFTRKFVIKGFFFGLINLIIIGILSGILHSSLVFPLWNTILILWISIFSTMSFSGYTFDTGPHEIEQQYDLYQKISRVLLIGGVALSLIGLYLFIRS